MPYVQPLSPDDSWALEIECGIGITGTYYTGTFVSGTYYTGTYYYITHVIDMTIHSGTMVRITPGDYMSTPPNYPMPDVVDAYAIEGEWKIVKENDNNIMVADVATFPIARMQQYCGSDNNQTYNDYEFPHHHMTPKEINGDVTTLLSEDAGIHGIVTHGDYLFFTKAAYPAELTIKKMDMRDGSISSTPQHFPSEVLQLYVMGDYEIAVLDDDTVMFTVEAITEDMGIFFATYNFATGDFDTVAWPYPFNYPYIWHWAVIGKYLCISTVEYVDTSPYSGYSFHNHIYNYTTKIKILDQKLPGFNNWGNLQYPVCNDVIIGKKYFCTWHFGYSDPDPGFDNDAHMFVFNVEEGSTGGGFITIGDQLSCTQVLLRYKPITAPGEIGCCTPYQMCYNPFNGMVYFIAFHSYLSGGYSRWCWAIMIMSPDNYSHIQIYEYTWFNAPPFTLPDKSQIPSMLIPGMFETYCVMANGDVYNVRDLTTLICTLPAGIWEGALGGGDWEDNQDKPQHDKCASCLDRWDRLWYIDGSQLVALNFKTGVEDYRISAGINNVWRGSYCSPNHDFSYQHVYLARDRILVMCRADGSCPVHPSSIDYIYKIE